MSFVMIQLPVYREAAWSVKIEIYFGGIEMDKKKTMNWIIAIIVAIGYLTISIMFDAWTYSWFIWVIYAIYRFVAK